MPMPQVFTATAAAARWLAASALVAMVQQPAHAFAIYDSLQYGPSTVDAFGYLVGEVSNVYNQPALKFTAQAGGAVGSVSFYAQGTGNTGLIPVDFVVRLWADNANLPGALIETIAAPGIASDTYDTYTVDSALNPVLTAGDTYWLSLSTTVTNTGNPLTNSGIWRFSNGPFGNQIAVAFDSAGSPPWSLDPRDFQAPMLRINGVPEPHTGLLVTLALGLALAGPAIRARVSPRTAPATAG